MTKDKIETILEDGRIVMAQAPVIISASRSTDIPAFYADWFSIGYKLVIRLGQIRLTE